MAETALMASDLASIPPRERFDDIASASSPLAALNHAVAAAGREISHASFFSLRRDLPASHAARQIAERLQAMNCVRLLDAALDEREALAMPFGSAGEMGDLAASSDDDDRSARPSLDASVSSVLGLLGVDRDLPAAAAQRPGNGPGASLDETVVQFSIRGLRWVADKFRELCRSDRRTRSDMGLAIAWLIRAVLALFMRRIGPGVAWGLVGQTRHEFGKG
ncbi:MAG: hypothetical protein ACU0DT_06900 [Albimonas sp.]|uniref:hypothetical protein n=1 Tax=Albimonas sp. TaxID=1872425 RepID=UPI00405637A9